MHHLRFLRVGLLVLWALTMSACGSELRDAAPSPGGPPPSAHQILLRSYHVLLRANTWHYVVVEKLKVVPDKKKPANFQVWRYNIRGDHSIKPALNRTFEVDGITYHGGPRAGQSHFGRVRTVLVGHSYASKGQGRKWSCSARSAYSGLSTEESAMSFAHGRIVGMSHFRGLSIWHVRVKLTSWSNGPETVDYLIQTRNYQLSHFTSTSVQSLPPQRGYLSATYTRYGEHFQVQVPKACRSKDKQA
jgi:hypothetical protein